MEMTVKEIKELMVDLTTQIAEQKQQIKEMTDLIVELHDANKHLNIDVEHYKKFETLLGIAEKNLIKKDNKIKKLEGRY